jgi:hypothetical protein
MAKAISQEERNKRAVLDTLGQLGKLSVQDDSLAFEGNKIVLPETYSGRVMEAVKFLLNYEEQQNTVTSFNRVFKYRPWDGAHAFQLAMKLLFGSAGIGVTKQTMFGPVPPQMQTIDIAVGKTTQVPWGEIRLDQLEATFTVGSVRDPEYGLLFHLNIEGPRKYQPHYEAFFQVVQDQLEKNSIYKGKAIDGGQMPSFIDLDRVDETKVYYANDVMDQMRANVFSVLDHSQLFRAKGMPLKRSVLLEGPYGTGKTLFGVLTAKRAVKNNWTYILCRPGKDSLADVLQTAQLYAPAVVWFEDVDTQAGVDEIGNSLGVSKVLDILDGASNKGAEILACFTTNHVDKLQKGVLRPGRLDSIIHVGHLDRDGFEKLIRLTLPAGDLDPNVDYDAVHEAFKGYLPAFAVEAVRRAMRFQIARTDGKPQKVTTADLVAAGNDLRRQLELMDAAKETRTIAPFEAAFEGAVAKVLNRTEVRDGSSAEWTLAVVADPAAVVETSIN